MIHCISCGSKTKFIMKYCENNEMYQCLHKKCRKYIEYSYDCPEENDAEYYILHENDKATGIWINYLKEIYDEYQD